MKKKPLLNVEKEKDFKEQYEMLRFKKESLESLEKQREYLMKQIKNLEMDNAELHSINTFQKSEIFTVNYFLKDSLI